MPIPERSEGNSLPSFSFSGWNDAEAIRNPPLDVIDRRVREYGHLAAERVRDGDKGSVMSIVAGGVIQREGD